MMLAPRPRCVSRISVRDPSESMPPFCSMPTLRAGTADADATPTLNSMRLEINSRMGIRRSMGSTFRGDSAAT